MREFKVVYHYSVNDPECYGDYFEVYIMEGNEIIGIYGDYYHDKGSEKVIGFFDGLTFSGIEYEIIQDENIADLDY